MAEQQKKPFDPDSPSAPPSKQRPQPEAPGTGRPMKRDDKEMPDERPVRREEPQAPETD